VAVAYVHKRGTDFIGWTDIGGEYRERTFELPDRIIPVFELASLPADRRFYLTNPAGYFMKYNGLVVAAEQRRSNGWQASGSYTWSQASGLQASSGTTAAGAQSSSVALPTAPIGRDPNDLTNARGRLPNDRPHTLRATTVLDLAGTGLVLAANLQHFSGKPWAATALVPLQQGDQRILLEPRGTRRLSSQTLLDFRLSRTIALGGLTRVDLMLDVLNALNEMAEEDFSTDNLYSPNFRDPHCLRRSAPRDDGREVESGAALTHFDRSNSTTFEFCRWRSNTMYRRSGVMSNVRIAPWLVRLVSGRVRLVTKSKNQKSSP
jgi:hypothetical protein